MTTIPMRASVRDTVDVRVNDNIFLFWGGGGGGGDQSLERRKKVGQEVKKRFKLTNLKRMP